MVQSWYGAWNIWVYTESAWESNIVLLYEWQQIRQQPQCHSERCLVCEKTWIQENMLKTYVKNSWREAHYHATCRRDYTREDDRHQETIKDTKTIEEQASNKTI